MSQSELLEKVRDLVSELTRARFEGGAYVDFARAQGYADGFMRALVDSQLVDERTLLHIIGHERTRVMEDEQPGMPPRHAGLEAAPAF